MAHYNIELDSKENLRMVRSHSYDGNSSPSLARNFNRTREPSLRMQVIALRSDLRDAEDRVQQLRAAYEREHAMRKELSAFVKKLEEILVNFNAAT